MMTTMTETRGRSLGVRLGRAAMFSLLALAATLYSAHEAQAQWVTSGTTTTTTNNVGIGTTTPSQMFHVHSGGTWAGTRVTTAATGTTINDGVHFGYDDGYGAYVWNREATPVILSTSNTERMRIDAAGNVGIGTATPSALLDLKVPTGDVVSRFSNAGGAGGALEMRYKYESQTHRMGLTDGNGQWMFYTQFAPSNTNSVGFFPGKVGVGVTAPSQALHVMGKGFFQTTAAPSALIMDRTDGKIASFGSGGTSATIAYDETGIFKIESNTRANIALGASFGGGANRFTIDGTGNVGIGTAAPAAKLHVTGDIRVDGNISAKYQDVAEWVPSTQKLSAGTVVVLDTGHDNHVAAASSPYDTRVAGVISAQPGLSLGDAGEGKVLVATTGRVKVRVDATQAPVKVGDLLVTSEREGYAMKSEPVLIGKRSFHSPGTIIGKALQSLDKGTGEILVLLSLQ